MVPLDEGARVSHSASFACAQDLGRFAPRPTSPHYGVLVSRTYDPSDNIKLAIASCRFIAR